MYYQLQDGRTVEISVEMFLSATDQDINALMSYDHGFVTNNPMHGSAIHAKGQILDKEDITEDICDVSSEEKRTDQDYTPDE